MAPGNGRSLQQGKISHSHPMYKPLRTLVFGGSLKVHSKKIVEDFYEKKM